MFFLVVFYLEKYCVATKAQSLKMVTVASNMADHWRDMFQGSLLNALLFKIHFNVVFFSFGIEFYGQ